MSIADRGIASIVLVVLLAWVNAAAAANESPQEMIRSVTGNVLETLREHNADNAMSQKQLVALIEQQVVPYFDFNLMSAQVLGRYWRNASEAQREQFTAFRQLLTNTYAAVFGRYEGQAVEMLGMHQSGGSDRVLVSTLVKKPGKPEIKVDYRLYQNKGAWKIYDVVADGISLLINYRSEYANELSRGSLDGLIAKLQAKNTAFGSKSP